jgi:hypothetical protein
MPQERPEFEPIEHHAKRIVGALWVGAGPALDAEKA